MNVCEFKKLSVWGYDKFILSTDLISPTRRLVEEDCLKVHCRVWIEGEVKHKICNGGAAKRSLPEDEKAKKRKDRLASDFGKLFRDSLMTDIAVTTPRNTFMAHKAVLAGTLALAESRFLHTNIMHFVFPYRQIKQSKHPSFPCSLFSLTTMWIFYVDDFHVKF